MDDVRVFANMNKVTIKAQDSGWVRAVTEMRSFAYGTHLASLVALSFAKAPSDHAYYYTVLPHIPFQQ